jgi:hypothetical protein
MRISAAVMVLAVLTPIPLAAQQTAPRPSILRPAPVLRPQSPVSRVPAASGPPWTITTVPLTLMGGAMTSFAPFAPVTLTTQPLTLVGGGTIAFAPFQPVNIATPALTLVGQ